MKMLIERPNHKELTSEELQGLQQLKAVIDRVVADGKISQYDKELIDHMINADGKVLVEELTLVRQLIRDKLDSGLISSEWDS
jgi:hypothetical protein